MNSFILQSLLVASLGFVSAFPENSAEANNEGKQTARRLLKPVHRTLQVADRKNADLGKEDVNVTDRLPVRLPHLFAIKDEECKNCTKTKDEAEPLDARITNSLAHGKASKERPTTASVKMQEQKLKAAWIKYADPPHTMQPMVAICASMLQGARSEYAYSPCSMEAHESLELLLRAEPYCKFFDKDFKTSVTDIEKQADTWCGKAACEPSVEVLADIEKDCMDVAVEQPDELLAYVKTHKFRVQGLKGTLSEFVSSWQKTGCFPKVCTTLEQQASQVNDAYIAYSKLGSAHASFATEVKLEGLVLYDLYTVSGCK